MLERLKLHWHDFRSTRPGQRFQTHHRVRAPRVPSTLRRYALASGGALLVLTGLVMLPAPGPGMLVLIAGAVLLAQSSKRAARVFDGFDLRLHRAQRWGLALWRRTSVPLRGLAVLLGLVVVGGLGLGTYHLLF